ncbi:MAG TPA: acyl-CoA carboxylase epsilon subunit [Candidatus Baltobacteraceae bacterium]|nr:acyl-CoA carboxylase epsilon subunit [Candidatus Baltobacteraceae bacterium]
MTDEELAALAVAVAAVTQERAAAGPEGDRMPAWRRAMREESVQSGV